MAKVDLFDATEKDLEDYGLKKGDILFNRTNSLHLVGKSAVCRTDLKAVFASYLVRFRMRSSQADPRFVAYWLNSSRGKSRLRALATPGVSQSNINPTTLKLAMKVPCPKVGEQERVADLLTTWDEALENLDALIQAKEHRKKALMQQVLTGKKRLKGFVKEWETKPIGNLLKEVRRPVEWDDDHLYRLVSIRRRSGGFFFREPLHGRDIKTKNMQTTKAGDFVIAKMQVLHGAMAMTPPEFDDAHISGSYITMVSKDENSLHMPFFDWLSRTTHLYHLAYISSYGVVIEKMTFILRDFLKHEVMIPPTIEEQQAIVGVLDTCEVELRLLRQQRDAIDRQKRGLMQRILTGKIRVKV